MKKYLLLMMAVLSFGGLTVKAQSFEFQYQGQSLKDGDMVTIAAEENVFGELGCETNPSANPDNGLVLKFPEGSKGKVRGELEILHNTLNASIVQWCMGGECTMLGDKTSLTKMFDAADIVQTQFDASNIRNTGYLMARMSVTYDFVTLVVNIQFTNGESAGINNMQKRSEPQKVYNLSGQLLLDDAVGIKSLPAGIYIVGGKKYVNH